MPINDLARSDVVTASPEAPIAELAQQMQDAGVGSVVLTEGDQPVGIVTDRDLAIRVLADESDPDGLVAEDVMTENLCTVSPGAGFYEAAQTMSENAVRRLPVCEEGGQLAGILTADDLTELLADEHDQLASIIKAQRPAY